MKAAIIGAGVIGQGWAVRFALFGWDVAIYDENPESLAQCRHLIDRVRPLVLELYENLPATGEVTQSTDLDEVLQEADWVQESLPEDLQIKKHMYQRLSELSLKSPICSSTSGFMPSVLAGDDDDWRTRLLVCHPFNPVYLLPLVEVVPHPDVDSSKVALVEKMIQALGMQPLVLEKEIDAHIADRLLEAVWREALWMVKDGVATTAQIDQAITHGFGLRWAQMGLFETYRLGGGPGGMAHFLKQFAPALQWPWSKLTDVPELDDALIEKIVRQSDAQSGAYSLDELSTARDENLVALLQALKTQNWGAGNCLNRWVQGNANAQ